MPAGIPARRRGRDDDRRRRRRAGVGRAGGDRCGEEEERQGDGQDQQEPAAEADGEWGRWWGRDDAGEGAGGDRERRRGRG